MSESKYDKYIGMKLEPVTFDVVGDRIRQYAKATDDPNPQFFEKDDGKLLTPLAFTSVYWISAIPNFLKKVIDEGIIKDLSRLLHGGQRYEFLKLVKPGDKLELYVEIKNIYIKNNMLFLEFSLPVKNQNEEMVSILTTTFIIRPGGF
ncbi:MAG: FAS1-like dehydratase domain-containing protein [Candidatus Jordarchaeum sp.]|uniref:FAS1-like dehydratase domain-containing protein n=1 Tax=Candidatus Jordarchaeum sp. TaxID=2823881 RepID=UPI00404912CB